MTTTKHRTYTAVTARGLVLLKCSCGFEVVEATEADAEAAHAIGKTSTLVQSPA